MSAGDGHHWSCGTLLSGRRAVLRDAGGETWQLPADRWFGPVTPEEWRVLDRALPPVLDVGCGPGRHVAGLAARGVPALGIDVAEGPLRLARRRGARVLAGSVFDPVPGDGSWGTVLLLDGSIGIGGDPARLLSRCAALLRPAGHVLVEAEPPGAGLRRTQVCVHDAGEAGSDPAQWFPWARVGIDALPELVAAAGLDMTEPWEEAGRWFTDLVTP